MANSTMAHGEVAFANEAPRFLLRTMGALELRPLRPDGSVGSPVLSAGKPLAMLAYCLCSPKRTHRRDQVAELLWADSAIDRRRQNLRQALWRLRRVLGDCLLDSDDDILPLTRWVLCDRNRLLAALSAGDMDAVVGTYRGRFLGGLSMTGADQLEDWIGSEQRWMEQQVVQALQTAVSADEEKGHGERVRRWLQEALVVGEDSVQILRAVAGMAAQIEDSSLLRDAARRLDQQGVETSSIDASGFDTPDVANAVERAQLRPPRPRMELTARDDQIALVMQAWRRARRGEAQVVGISGRAGIGKSRLLEAIRNRCNTRDSILVELRAMPGERDMEYAFLSHFTRALAQLPGSSGVSEAIAADLVAFDPGLASVYHAASPGSAPLVNALTRRTLAVSELLEAVCEEQAVTLLLDDLHWCDRTSSEVLNAMLGRLTQLPLLVVGTARGMLSVLGHHPRFQHVPLQPLSREAAIAAIRSYGRWPTDEAVDRFISTLATHSEGLPQGIVERLDLAVERRWVEVDEQGWHSKNWATATDHIRIFSPLDHLLTTCSEHEREILLMLAVAGGPIDSELVRESGLQVDTTLWFRLESKGLVTLDDGSPRLSHDDVMERLLALSTHQEQVGMHRRLMRAFATADHAGGQASALRHALAAQSLVDGAQLFASLVRRLRHHGDRRDASAILGEACGAQLDPAVSTRLLRAVPLWDRSITMRRALVIASGASMMAVLLAFSHFSTRLPALVVTNGGGFVNEAPVFGDHAIRFVPPITIRVGDGGTAFEGTTVRARAGSGVTSILAGAKAIADSTGVVAFGALRVRLTDSLGTIHFDTPGYRSTSHAIRAKTGNSNFSTAFLLEGVLNNQPLLGPSAEVTVTRSARISGIVQLRYSTLWAAASVWASLTPTWGDHQLVGRDLFTVSTPVRDDVLDVLIDVNAPEAAGNYWILIAISAEDAGGFTLSRTNWTFGVPLWNDGHDLADLTNSEITGANQRGYIRTTTTYGKDWPTDGRGCQRRRSASKGVVQDCPIEFALVGIRVVVLP